MHASGTPSSWSRSAARSGSRSPVHSSASSAATFARSQCGSTSAQRRRSGAGSSQRWSRTFGSNETRTPAARAAATASRSASCAAGSTCADEPTCSQRARASSAGSTSPGARSLSALKRAFGEKKVRSPRVVERDEPHARRALRREAERALDALRRELAREEPPEGIVADDAAERDAHPEPREPRRDVRRRPAGADLEPLAVLEPPPLVREADRRGPRRGRGRRGRSFPRAPRPPPRGTSANAAAFRGGAR